MNRTKLLILTGLLAVVMVGTAQAQVGSPEGLGLGARYIWNRNQNTEEETNMFGAMARMRGRFVGVEGSVDYRNEELGGNVELKSWPVSASLMIYPIPELYGLAGLGWYNTTLDFPDGSIFEDNTSTDLGYHVGAGVEVPIATSLSLTGDARWLFVDYEFDEIPSTIGEVDSDALTLNAGLLIYLR